MPRGAGGSVWPAPNTGCALTGVHERALFSLLPLPLQPRKPRLPGGTFSRMSPRPSPPLLPPLLAPENQGGVGGISETPTWAKGEAGLAPITMANVNGAHEPGVWSPCHIKPQIR